MALRPAHVRLGERLTAMRKQAELTQVAVAMAMKMPQSFVAKYEAGDRRLDVFELIALCRVLRADPVKLVKILLSEDT